MSTATHLATIAELEAHPGRCELINGEIVEKAPTNLDHGDTMGAVAEQLRAYNRRVGFGKVFVGDPGLRFDEETVRAPDLAVIESARLVGVSRQGYASVVPNLVVEILSPHDRWTEVKEKIRMWLGRGVSMVWLVDPRTRTVEIHTTPRSGTGIELTTGDTIAGDPVLPGFSCPVDRFFED